ncbi:MAG TPA: hypothetical protein VJC18_07020, partial [bacterium]|nr:hypothetical protein [bacterium]
VFIFMYKGRTATFAGLVNRLTSLIAGTVATLFVWLLMGGKFPKPQDWVSLALMFVAIFFLSLSELKRTKELAATRELDEVANDVVVKESIPCKTSCCCGGR